VSLARELSVDRTIDDQRLEEVIKVKNSVLKIFRTVAIPGSEKTTVELAFVLILFVGDFLLELLRQVELTDELDSLWACNPHLT
jgi:hypothetical protein